MLQGAVEVMCDVVRDVDGESHAEKCWGAPPHTHPNRPRQVYISGQELLQYEGALAALMHAAERLLSPAMDESMSVFVGHLLLDLIEQHPHTLEPMLPQVREEVM